MYTHFKYMLNYIFSSSVCLEKIKMLQIYVNIVLQAASGYIPLFHGLSANSGDTSNTKILISRFVIQEPLKKTRVFLTLLFDECSQQRVK